MYTLSTLEKTKVTILYKKRTTIRRPFAYIMIY